MSINTQTWPMSTFILSGSSCSVLAGNLESRTGHIEMYAHKENKHFKSI